MQKILLLSDSLDSCSMVRDVLERNLPYQVYGALDSQSLQVNLESRVFSLCIIDSGKFGPHEMQIVLNLRQSHGFPILVLTAEISADLQNELAFYHDVHLLMKPMTENGLLGLVRKLLVAHRVPKQVYRRFNTNQIAEVEALSSGDCILTSLYNLSKGGAYCEYDGQAPMSVGDILRLKVFLNDTNSEYTFNAKVVWTTNKGRFSGRFGCGFKFVSGRGTYR